MASVTTVVVQTYSDTAAENIKKKQRLSENAISTDKGCAERSLLELLQEKIDHYDQLWTTFTELNQAAAATQKQEALNKAIVNYLLYDLETRCVNVALKQSGIEAKVPVCTISQLERYIHENKCSADVRSKTFVEPLRKAWKKLIDDMKQKGFDGSLYRRMKMLETKPDIDVGSSFTSSLDDLKHLSSKITDESDKSVSKTVLQLISDISAGTCMVI